ncbi:MAG: pyridoxamine 5'-phosphate oxidase family protein [Propionibacteriales bacterium]|nr:pyridoxamine 5'-phosphate oxidase family protein [Propionibacteriales bacterium]
MTSTAHAPVTESGADEREIADVLADSKLAYVAISTARGPLVTPVLYGTGGGAIWVLTNNHALKTKVWRKRPRAAWTVRSGEASVSFTGEATLLSVRDAKAVLKRPLGLVAVPPAVLSWASRNPRQVIGFVQDTLAHPSRGMPQDFVLVRLQPDSATVVPSVGLQGESSSSTDPRIAASGVPADLARLAGQSVGVLGLATDDGPVALPVGWDPATSTVRLPREWAHLGGSDLADACITFDEPVRLRPTEQRGVVLRGRVRPGPGPDELVLEAIRATYWAGFVVRTLDLA